MERGILARMSVKNKRFSVLRKLLRAGMPALRSLRS